MSVIKINADLSVYKELIEKAGLQLKDPDKHNDTHSPIVKVRLLAKDFEGAVQDPRIMFIDIAFRNQSKDGKAGQSKEWVCTGVYPRSDKSANYRVSKDSQKTYDRASSDELKSKNAELQSKDAEIEALKAKVAMLESTQKYPETVESEAEAVPEKNQEPPATVKKATKAKKTSKPKPPVEEDDEDDESFD